MDKPQEPSVLLKQVQSGRWKEQLHGPAWQS
jgi:hypothetical protein